MPPPKFRPGPWVAAQMRGPGPPRRPLPAGRFVRIVEEAFDSGRFMLVTVGLFAGSPLGPRLDRGRGSYPTCSTRDLTRGEAEENFKVWERFMELQRKENKK